MAKRQKLSVTSQNALINQIPCLTYNNNDIIDIVIKIKENIITNKFQFPKPSNKGLFDKIHYITKEKKNIKCKIIAGSIKCIRDGNKYYKYSNGIWEKAIFHKNEIFWITQIKSMDLIGDSLTNLPNFVVSLTNLQELILKNNKLTVIPNSIERLTNLQILDLSYNKLTNLPNSIGKLCNLQKLDLTHNKLRSLPRVFALKGCSDCLYSIKDFTKLSELYIDESSYQIDNLDCECEILVLGSITNKITNLPFNLKELYLKKDIDISMIKIPFGCEIKYDHDSILKYNIFNVRCFSVFQYNMIISNPPYPSTKRLFYV
jgi:hypothetical protein